MDFFKDLTKLVQSILPVNKIIKFIIVKFLSSYLIINDTDIHDADEDSESKIKNLIDLDNLQLNVSNINHEHLLHSPIKILNGVLGKFTLDITNDNKIIISIEDMNLELMPLFNYYKKYQKTIFNIEKEKKQIIKDEIIENNKHNSKSNNNINNKSKTNLMDYLANKLLSNLEINIKNISIKLFTYEIKHNSLENPVFSLYIMNINIYKQNPGENNTVNDIIDPNTGKSFEHSFLKNLIFEIDKICLKVDQHINSKNDEEFKNIKNIINNNTKNHNLTKEQKDKILSFFIGYNSILAFNYLNGPSIKININTNVRKDNEGKLIENMNLDINLQEIEFIISPQQLFNIQILTEISQFIFILNKHTSIDGKENKNINKNNKNDINNINNETETRNSGVFDAIKNENKNCNDMRLSFEISKNDEANNENNEENKEQNFDILGHVFSEYVYIFNCKRISGIILENKNCEIIPKLFSFLFQQNINSNTISSIESYEFLENYFSYFEDNFFLFNINNIVSKNNNNLSFNKIIFEYVQPNKKIEKEPDKNTNNKNIMNSDLLYETANNYETFDDDNDDDLFESAVESSTILLMSNYNKYLGLEYQYSKFEILIINRFEFDINNNQIKIKEITINFSFILLLLFIKIFRRNKYFIDFSQPMFTDEDIININDLEKEGNLNVNLEKRINNSEMQLFKNLANTYSKESNKNNNDINDSDLNNSIEYNEEEKNKHNGINITIEYFSLKIYNLSNNKERFDSNLFYYNIFNDCIYPYLPKKNEKNINNNYNPLNLDLIINLLSKDYIEIIFNNTSIIYYNVSGNNKLNINFDEILLKYWSYIIIQYNNNNKNILDDNPNIDITLPSNIIVDLSDNLIVNMEKTVLDDLLKFINYFTFGLSMYQIVDKFSKDIYLNKISNLFDLFGLKNHLNILYNIDGINDIKNENIKLNKENEKIYQETKPSFSMGGRINKCIININKNGTFDENEGNLLKIKFTKIGVIFEMFDSSNNNEVIYNNLSLSINKILVSIKEHSNECENNYFNILRKNKCKLYKNTDIFSLNFKFRNIIKTNDDIILEEDEFNYDENDNTNNINEKEKKYETNNNLDQKTKDYIEFLLNNQVSMDNMEMIINIKLNEIFFESFFHKLDLISSSFNDLFINFTSPKTEEIDEISKNSGIYQQNELIPLCEDRLMLTKIKFEINHLLMDLFFREDCDKKNWMRILIISDNINITMSENGLCLILLKNYIYMLKDFNYIYSMTNESLFDVYNKINKINNEESYLKRLGYTEIFFNDKIEFEKEDKKLKLLLGNININFCKDTFESLLNFINYFEENYLNKIKDIFVIDTLDLNNSDEEETENKNENINKSDEINNITNNDKKNDEIKDENKNKNEIMDEFEVVDDIFFMDDMTNNNKKNDRLNKNNKENNLQTIPEESHKTKKKKDIKNSDENNNDFTVIETNTSYQNKVNREKKEEECIKYIIELTSIRIYLFQGSDFSFEDEPQKDLKLNDSGNSNSNDNSNNIEKNKENLVNVDNSYIEQLIIKSNINNKNKKIDMLNKRKKIDNKDYGNFIILNLVGLSLNTIDLCYFDFVIQNFYIDDNFSKSQFNKIISQYDFSNESNTNFLNFNLEINKTNTQKEIYNVSINLNIPSLNILLDQLPLTFLLKIFFSHDFNNSNKNNINIDKNKTSNEEDNIKDKNSKDNINSKDEFEFLDDINENNMIIYVNKIFINSFNLNFHYHSHKISFKKLISNGDFLELLNGLADVNELNLKFKNFKKFYRDRLLTDVLNDLFIFWKDDIVKNQMTDSLLRSFTITRPFFKLYEGVIDLIRQPYISYKKNEGLKKGFKRGVKKFLVNFSSQGIFLGEKVFRGVKIVLFHKTKLSLNKKSLYKAWVYKINKKKREYEAHFYKSK